MHLIAGVLGRAGEAGQKRRLEDAKNGHISWLPPVGLGKPKTEEEREKEKAMQAASTPLKEKVDEDEMPALARRGRRGSMRMEEEDDDDL